MTGEYSYVPSVDTKCHHFLYYGGKNVPTVTVNGLIAFLLRLLDKLQ